MAAFVAPICVPGGEYHAVPPGLLVSLASREIALVSLRPAPVMTHTTVSPARIWPPLAASASAATTEEEAGSAKMLRGGEKDGRAPVHERPGRVAGLVFDQQPAEPKFNSQPLGAEERGAPLAQCHRVLVVDPGKEGPVPPDSCREFVHLLPGDGDPFLP